VLVSWETRAAAGDLPEVRYEPLRDSPPALTGAARVMADGMLPPEAPSPEGEQALPADRERLLELFFAVEERLRSHKREQTFLSIDVAGSTALKAGEDALAVEFSFRSYHRFVDRVVQEHGGQISSTSGDGVLAAFDQPEEAARAGAALQSGLAEFNRTSTRLRRPFALRCGINTGEVLLQEGQDSRYLFSGVVDTACNIQQACAPGEVWISDASVEGARRALGAVRRLPDPVDGVTVHAWPAAESAP
jgi:class 3 adenylate cyclase